MDRRVVGGVGAVCVAAAVAVGVWVARSAAQGVVGCLYRTDEDVVAPDQLTVGISCDARFDLESYREAYPADSPWTVLEEPSFGPGAFAAHRSDLQPTRYVLYFAALDAICTADVSSLGAEAREVADAGQIADNLAQLVLSM